MSKVGKATHANRQNKGAEHGRSDASGTSSTRKGTSSLPARLRKSASEKLSAEIGTEKSQKGGSASRERRVQVSPHRPSVSELPGTPTWGEDKALIKSSDLQSPPQTASSIQSFRSSPSNSLPSGALSRNNELLAPTVTDRIYMDARNIQTGSILVCISEDDDVAVDVWESMVSHVPIGKIHYGETLIASGPAQEVVTGCYLVPISPSGVVELEFFSLRDSPAAAKLWGGGEISGRCPSSASNSTFRRSFESSESGRLLGRSREVKAEEREKARKSLAKELFRKNTEPSGSNRSPPRESPGKSSADPESVAFSNTPDEAFPEEAQGSNRHGLRVLDKSGHELVPSSSPSCSSKTDSHGRLKGGMHMPSSDEGQRFGLEIVAGERDLNLGMKHRWSGQGYFPKAFVDHVEADSWASKKQLTPGTEILSINGLYICDIKMQTFLSELEKRPLCLTVRSPPQSPIDSVDEKQAIDMSGGSIPRDTVTMPPEEEPSPNLELLQTLGKTQKPVIRQTADRIMGSPSPYIASDDNVNFLDRDAIRAGTILTCTYRGNYGAADVWENVRVPRVINVLYYGSCVMAAGAPVEIRTGFFLIPILPHGAVEADCFEPIEIAAGTNLVCTSEEAEVWANRDSAQIVGVLQKGTAVKATGAPSLEADMVMVPILPRGAIDLDYFGLLHAQREEDVRHVQLDGMIAEPKEWVNPGAGSIYSGELLVCLAEEGANIHAACASKDVIGSILFREHVVARGRLVEFEGAFWVPVRPAGYVELALFRLASQEEANTGMLPSPNSNRVLLGLSRWASGICGPLQTALDYILQKHDLMEPHISKCMLRRDVSLSDCIAQLPEATEARSFGRDLACSWMTQNDAAFRTMLHPIPDLDITLLRVFLTYLEWAVRLRPEVTVDLIMQTWATFSSNGTSRRYTAQQDQSLLLDLLGMRAVGEPVDETTMGNLAEMLRSLEEMLKEDEDAARRRLVFELMNRLEAFYGSVEDGIREMVGPEYNGITIDDFSAHLGFLRVFAHSDYDPLAAELFDVLDMDGDGLISISDWVEAFALMSDPENPESIEKVKKEIAHIAAHRAKGESSSDEEEKRRKSELKHKDAVLHAFGFGSEDEDEDVSVKGKGKGIGRGKVRGKHAEVKKIEPKKRPSLLAAVLVEKKKKEREEKERAWLQKDDRSVDYNTTKRSSVEREEPSSDEEYSSHLPPSELHRRVIDELVEADVGEGALDTISPEERRLAEHRAEREVSINGKWVHDKHVMVITGVNARFENGEVCEVHCIGTKKYECIFNGLTLKGKLMEDHRRLIWRHEHVNMVWHRDLCEASLKKVKWYLGMRIMDPHPERFFQRFDPVRSGLLSGDAVREMIRDALRISPRELSEEDVDAFVRPLDCDGVSIHDLVQFMEIGIAAITSLDAEKAYGDRSKKTEERLKIWKREHGDGGNPKLKRIGLSETASRLLQARLKAAAFGTKPEELVKRYEHNNCGFVDIDGFAHFIRATLKIPPSEIDDKAIVRLYVALDTDGDHNLDLKEFANLVRFGISYLVIETPEQLEALKARAKSKAAIQKDKLNRAAAYSESRRHSQNLLQELSQADVSSFLQAKQQLKKGDSNVRIYSLLSAYTSQHGYPSALKKDRKTRSDVKSFVEEYNLDLPRGALDRLLTALDPNETGEVNIRQLSEFLEHPTKTPAKMLAARGLPVAARGKVELARNPFAGTCGVARFRKQLLDRAQSSSADIDTFLQQYDKGTAFLDLAQVRALMDGMTNSTRSSDNQKSPRSSQFSKSDVKDLVVAIGGNAEGIRLDALGAFLKTPMFLLSDKSTAQVPKTLGGEDFRVWRPPVAPLSDNPWLRNASRAAAFEASMRMEVAKAASPRPQSMNINISAQKRSHSEPRRFDPRKSSRSPQNTFNVAGSNPAKRRAAPSVSPRQLLAQDKANSSDWHERLNKNTTNSWDHRFVPGFQSPEKARKPVDNAIVDKASKSGNPMTRQILGSRSKESNGTAPAAGRANRPQQQKQQAEAHVPGSRAARLQARQQQQEQKHQLQRQRDESAAAKTIQTQWRARKTQGGGAKKKKFDAEYQSSATASDSKRQAAATVIQSKWREREAGQVGKANPQLQNRSKVQKKKVVSARGVEDLQLGNVMQDAQKVTDMRKDLESRRCNIEKLQAEVEAKRLAAMIETEKTQLQESMMNREKVQAKSDSQMQGSVLPQTLGLASAKGIDNSLEKVGAVPPQTGSKNGVVADSTLSRAASDSVAWKTVSGYIVGDHLHEETLTIVSAKLKCKELPGCTGFYYQGSPDVLSDDGPVYIVFGNTSVVQEGWQTFTSCLMLEAADRQRAVDEQAKKSEDIKAAVEIKAAEDRAALDAATKAAETARKERDAEEQARKSVEMKLASERQAAADEIAELKAAAEKKATTNMSVLEKIGEDVANEDVAAQTIQSEWRKHMARIKAVTVATTKKMNRMAKRQRHAAAVTFQSGMAPKRKAEPDNEAQNVPTGAADDDNQKQLQQTTEAEGADDYGFRAFGLGTMFVNALSAVAPDGEDETHELKQKKKKKKKGSATEGDGQESELQES